MFQFLLGVLILASNFLGVSRAVATTCQPITTLQELQNMGTTGNYCLVNDIDASSTSTSPFTPIGSDSNPFVGVFDGNGHVIDKLTIVSANFSGLFGSIGSVGVVQNVGITNGAIPNGNTGGLLAGENNGIVTNCFATGAITSGGSGLAGGLIGWNKGQISNSHAMVFVQRGPGGRTGGFVGQNDTTGSITQSYASGQVSPFSGGDLRSGGFVGSNDGTITKSYATGNVTGPGYYGHVGGFVGDTGGTISQSYATGSVTGNGGIAGGCQWRAEFPQLWRSKIPQFGGCGDQPSC